MRPLEQVKIFTFLAMGHMYMMRDPHQDIYGHLLREKVQT